MKHIATMALLFHIGVAGVYAQERGEYQWHQSHPVKMTFSGTNVATTIGLQPNTVTDEQQSAGHGTFGGFTFRELHADGPAAQPPSGCASPLYFAVVAGAGVFHFQDGSLLIVTITEGSGCIDLATGTAMTVKYQITGGTGRFEGASGALTYTATMTPVLFNALNRPALLMLTGKIEGRVSERP